RGAPEARTRPLPRGVPGHGGGSRSLRSARGLAARRGVGRCPRAICHRRALLPRPPPPRGVVGGHLACGPRRGRRPGTALRGRTHPGIAETLDGCPRGGHFGGGQPSACCGG